MRLELLLLVLLHATLVLSSADQYSQTQLVIGNLSSTCPQQTGCATGCLDCSGCNIYQCSLCANGYFIYTLPQDNPALKLSKGDSVCVRCPFMEYPDPFSRYCGDCIENSETWQLKRTCTYDYQMKSPSSETGAYLKTPASSTTLFFVLPYTYDSTMEKANPAPYQTVQCLGCGGFCPTQTLTCLPVSDDYIFDTSLNFISCSKGYVYNQLLAACDKCPYNCQTCTISINVDDNGIKFAEKKCLLCSSGFALYKGYPYIEDASDADDQAAVETRCEPCFKGCSTCYFGSDVLNLNNNPNAWDLYLNLTYPNTTWQEVQSILATKNIALRCTKCKATSTAFYLPALNMTSCEGCGNYCAECEYVFYKNKQNATEAGIPFTAKQLKYFNQNYHRPTRYQTPILNSNPFYSRYIQRCRRCQNSTGLINYAGVVCDDCTVENCQICYYDLGGGATSLGPDFTPTSSGTLRCGICNVGYKLSADGQTCAEASGTDMDAIPNCQIYGPTSCSMCETGYKLDVTGYLPPSKQSGVCYQGCAFEIGDFFCDNCYTYSTGTGASAVSTTRCLKCTYGYYVDVVTGRCVACSQDPQQITCGDCRQYSYQETYDFSTLVLKPTYNDTQLQSIKNNDDIISQPYCVSCTVSDSIQLNPYTGYCESCGNNCLECNYDVIKTYCVQCEDSIGSRSTDTQGTDCIQCPQYCVGCRDRSQNEQDAYNPFFNPSNQKLEYYQRICFSCASKASTGLNLFYDSSMGRCVACDNPNAVGCYSKSTLDFYMFCQSTQYAAYSEDPLAYKYVDFSSYFQTQTSPQAVIQFNQVENYDNFKLWNDNAQRAITYNVHLMQSADTGVDPNVAGPNECVMTKDVNFTTGIMQNVFALQDLILNITVIDATSRNAIKGVSNITFYMFRNFFIEYFTQVNIEGITIQPASDWNFKRSGQLTVPNPTLKQNPFGIKLEQVTHSTFRMFNVQVYQLNASWIYFNQTNYQGPISAFQLSIKKYTPFFIQLLNPTSLTLENVGLTSFSYLTDPEVKFASSPISLEFDRPVSSTNFVFNKVQLIDIAIDNRYFLKLSSMQFLGLDPSRLQTLTANSLFISDCAFMTGSGLFGQDLAKTESSGIIQITNLTQQNTYMNNSQGILNFWTAQSIKVQQCNFYNNTINATFQFWVNTIELNDVNLLLSQYTSIGRFLSTQDQAPQAIPIQSSLSGLTFNVARVRLDSVTCLSMNCFLYVSSPTNPYRMLMNVSLSDIQIGLTQSNGFDPAWINSANAAMIFIINTFQVVVNGFISNDNRNLTLLNVNNVVILQITNYICQSTPSDLTENSIKLINQTLDKDNMCLYVSDFFLNVSVSDVTIKNLVGIDNSFIVFSSWDTLVYNTTQQTMNGLIQEYITLQKVTIDSCQIFTTEISSKSGAVYVKSEQMQHVEMLSSLFIHNTQLQFLPATLTPSNPTFLMLSIVGSLKLHDSQWRDNLASGFGAVTYVETGTAVLYDLTMTGANWDVNQDINYANFSANRVGYGGHLYLQGYDMSITNCLFQNASALKGAGAYFYSIQQGLINVVNTTFESLYTSLTPAAQSIGGCVYVDSSNSFLNMTFNNVTLSTCSVRGDGGCLFIDPSNRDQSIMIMKSTFYNCYSLGGSSIKVSFDQRTVSPQILSLSQTTFKQDYFAYLIWASKIKAQNQDLGLNAVEQYIFLQRSAMIEQDYGEISLNNINVAYVYYQGFLSLTQVRRIALQSVFVQDGIIIYRPLIEIIQPFLNPTILNQMSFVNITGYTPTPLQCNSQQLDLQSSMQCMFLQAKIEFPEQLVVPPVIYVSQVTIKAPLQLLGVQLDKINCGECQGGLVQIMGVYKVNDAILEMVTIQDFSCSNSNSGYFGCLYATSESYIKSSSDDNFLQVKFASSFEISYLKGLMGGINARLSQKQKNAITGQSESNDLEDPSILLARVVDKVKPKESYKPNPPWAAHIRVQGSSFSTVNAYYGGSLAIQGLTANITDGTFYQSKVNGSGGGIYFEAEEKFDEFVFQRLNLWNCIFQQNYAAIGGAIRTINSGPSNVNKSMVQFQKNRAKYYGDNVGTYPSKLALMVNTTIQKTLQIDNNTDWVAYPIVMKSGQAFSNLQDQRIIFQLLDENSKIVKYQTPTSATLVTIPASKLSGSGKRDFDIDTQGYDFSNLVISLDPYLYITLDVNITSDAINIPRYAEFYPYYMDHFDLDYTLQARARSVECAVGEAYDRNDGSCSPCGPGTYVLKEKSVCYQMNAQTMNETYLNQISLKIGYWRTDISVDVAQFCFQQPQNCNGGWNVGNDLCIEGNIGALCEACDWYGVRWGQPYVTTEKFFCGKCADSESNVYIIIGLSIWTLYSIITSIKGTKEQMELLILDSTCKTIGWGSTSRAGANSALMIKILTNYLQILGTLSQFQLTIPAGTYTAANTVGQPSGAMGNALDCVLLKFAPVDVLYWKIIWTLIMYSMDVTAILILMGVGHALKKLQFKAQYVYTMCVYMFIFLHPNYVKDFILLVASRNISSTNWVQSNVAYNYDTWSHQRWMYALGWPGVIIWAIILPFSFMYVLYNGNKKGKLNSVFFKNSWGYFYNEYHARCYYWEFIKIFQKELIIIILIFYTDDVIVKGALVFIVVYLYGRMTASYRPYDLSLLNTIDEQSTNICCLSLIMGLLTYQSLHAEKLYIVYICYAVIAIINFCFILIIVYYLLFQFIEKFGKNLDQIRDKIVEKKPHLMDDPKLRPYLINRSKLNKVAKQKWRKLAFTVNMAVTKLKRKQTTKIVLVPLTEEQLLSIENRLVAERKNMINRIRSANGEDVKLELEEEVKKENPDHAVQPELEAQNLIDQEQSFRSDMYQLPEEGVDKYKDDKI